MKRTSIFSLLFLITLIVTACGPRVPEAAPTVNPVDLQSTVAAAAFTVIAETQAAIPTATPPPPTATFTYTPRPTLTLLPLPSSEGTLTPIPGGNAASDDPCLTKVLPPTLQGEPIRIRVDNSTRATVSLSVYLNQAGPNSECGYRSYTLAPGEYVVINNLVAACYTLWAWNPDPDEYFIATNGTSCLDASNSWVFDISTSTIRLNR
ncbi:MAG TPA: hypothetical protein VHO49_15335 [Anaerolineales bacterium]|nr:hypothetical protein [Anaerolineales bacterium]